MAHLAAAEDAASRNYSFPEEPEHYSTNVRSNIVCAAALFRRSTPEERLRPRVLVRSDDRNDSLRPLRLLADVGASHGITS